MTPTGGNGPANPRERWKQVEELYHEALARPVSAREAFVREARAGDDSLIEEVLSLLRHTSATESLPRQVMPPVPLASLAGQRIGVYQIGDELGAGGMGVVYRARDTRLGRDVAIKILPRTFAKDPDRVARFQREARVLASLNHPHIATVHGIEDTDGAPALVMELVEGETLSERLSRQRAKGRILPLQETLAIARQVADALDVIAVGAVAGAIGARWVQPAVADARATSRFAIPVAPTEVLPMNVAISPDGRYIAYLAGPPDHQNAYLRAVGDRSARVISELPMQAPQPFFSPDSQWLAYFDAGKLKKMPVAGGSSITLAEAPTPRGGCWSGDGTIVFAPISRGGLMWLPASGGQARTLTTPDAARSETAHRQPAFLPKSHTVLFVAESSGPARRSLQAVSLDTGQIRVVSVGDGLFPRYIPTGHLAQVLDGKLVVAPFDVDALQVTGPPVNLFDDVNSFSFSNDGTLVYSEAAAFNVRTSTLVWAHRDGSVDPLPLPPAVYDHPRGSLDGQAIVIHRAEGRPVDGYTAPASGGLWLYDVARDTLSKFTSGADDWPLWSADGKGVIYASNRPGTQWDIFARPVDGSGPETELLKRPLTQIPRAASPTGDALVYEETYPDRPNTLWRMPLRSPGEPQPLFGPGVGEMMPAFSPDGQWIAYVSPHSGHNEVYVRSGTGAGSIWPISNAGGVEPVWSVNGRELYYRADYKMMAVDVVPSTTAPSFGKPHLLFEAIYLFGATEGQGFDVSRDGRFLMLKPQHEPEPVPLSVIVNWFDEVRRRVAASQ